MYATGRLAAVLAASLALTACGDSNDPPSEPPTTQPPDPTLSAPEDPPPASETAPKEPGD